MNDEYNRLRAVSRFVKLDAAISRDLNDIAALIAEICDTPVALITLLGKETQWFAAAKGTEITHTPRAASFCNHTIKQDDVLIVPDMAQDKRFLSNPMVVANPNARFYAGSRLMTDDGYAIGSLCVVDFVPKNLTDSQQKALKVMAKQVINLLQLNWSLHNLEVHHKQAVQQTMLIQDSELKLKAVFDSSNDLYVLVGKHFEIMACNKAATEYLQKIYHKAPSPGENILSFVDEQQLPLITRCLLSALSGRSVKKEILARAGTEYACWYETKFVPIKNAIGDIIGVALNSSDISKRKLQEDQIKEQNEALTRIAIIQSHELRRPVASLLGLMNLMKMETEHSEQDYFGMMEVTVNELDEKIRLIVKDSEDTIQSNLSIVA